MKKCKITCRKRCAKASCRCKMCKRKCKGRKNRDLEDRYKDVAIKVDERGMMTEQKTDEAESPASLLKDLMKRGKNKNRKNKKKKSKSKPP